MRILRLSLRSGLLAASVIGTLVMVGPGTAGASVSAPQTVRAYVAAINAKDGKKICSLLYSAEAKALGLYLPSLFARPGEKVKPVPCPKIAEVIGSGGYRDNAQRWRHATILHMDAAKPATHGLVGIAVRMRDDWKDGGPSLETRTTLFWLTREHGRWVIVRHSSALEVAMFSDANNFADAQPATREPRATDVKIPAAKFTCSGQYWTLNDPLGDAHAAGSLDIRRVALADSPPICVTVQLAAPPMPGTAFEVSFGTETGQFLLIDADGNAWFTGNDKGAVAGIDYGMADATTIVMRFSNLQSPHPDALSVVAEPIPTSEPLIRTQPPINGGDRAGP